MNIKLIFRHSGIRRCSTDPLAFLYNRLLKKKFNFRYAGICRRVAEWQKRDVSRNRGGLIFEGWNVHTHYAVSNVSHQSLSDAAAHPRRTHRCEGLKTRMIKKFPSGPLYDSFLILKLHEQAVAITCSLTEHQRFETLSIKSRAVNEMTWKSVSVRDVQANSRSSHITLLYGDKITSRTSSKQHGQWLDVSTLGASRWFAPLTKLKTYAELTAIQHSSALHYEKRLWLTDSAFFSVFPDATAQRGPGPPHFLGF